MNKKFIGAGITFALVMVLIFIALSTKSEYKAEALSDFKSIKELMSKDKLDEAKKKMDEIKGKDSDSILLGKQYFDLGNLYEKKGDLVKARDIHSIILHNYQNIDNILEVQEKLGKLNTEILFSKIITDTDLLYKVEPGDSLSKIAKKFGTTVDLIKVSNSLESDVIRANSDLKVSKASYKILVDKSQNLLTILKDDDIIFKVYRVSTGENSSTPVGTFKIVNKIKDPVWYNQGVVVPSESPDNILGSRWLGFSNPGYGIHGTIEPDSVGRQATRGCIRMLNAEIEEVYTIIPVGTEVTIVE
ncbi:MAG: L,D-transpeptidase family protein [Candidatus Omnitrophica bacterium]|nr:L,D-transpeptidase family protein [Candidatus Omnitrophota bacterium]MBU1853086.1 L,D-transpeptidase family protein [Candidatus Omnitrophota bacterium]